MAFTYDWSLTDDDSKNITRIRSEIGDTVENKGVRPDGSNFDDDEVLYYYDDEGSSIGRASARLCEILSRSWARVPKTVAGDALEVDPKEVARNFMRSARQLREQYGFSSGVRVVLVQAERAGADD